MDNDKEESISIELTQSQYTVGWMCALTEELTAATVMLDNVHELPTDFNLPSTDDNVYVFGSVGKHNIVLTGLPKGKIGTVSAAVAARTMVNSFQSIKFGFMIGIGGGVPSEDNDIRLGDVVVSSPIGNFPGVVQWDLGKAIDGGGFERTGALNSPPRALLSALVHLESVHQRKGSSIPSYLQDLEVKEKRLMRSYGKSDILKDVLFSPDSPHRNEGSGRNRADCESCDTGNIIARGDRDEPIAIHYGLIASGNQVIKDANLRDKLNADFGGNVLCVEMEAAGLMESFPCLVIRGICDYADSHKNKKWQKYAALVAAAYAKELLMVVPCRAVEQMATIQSLLSGVSDKLDVISKHMQNSQQSIQHKAILEWLTPVSYDSQQHSIFHRRQEGTCQWFLQSEDFKQFLRKDSKLMFCEGFPGAGKTILASTVINYLRHDHRSLPEEKVGLAFMFGDFVQRSHQRPVDILASLTKQLLRDQAFVPQKMIDTYNTLREIAPSSRSNKDNSTFAEMLQKVISSIYTRVFIVIDALDELEEVQPLLMEVCNTVKRTSASLFVTSRPIEQIRRQIQRSFEGIIPYKIRAPDEDIERYIDERMLGLKVFSVEDTGYSPEMMSQLKIDINHKVSEVVDGIFLLAKFHLDALEGKTTPQKIRDSLETLYKGPDAYAQAYKKTMEKINSQEPEFQLLAKRVLGWLIFSKRVLSNLELRHALSVNAHDTSFPSQDRLENTHTILDVCMGLVITEGHDKPMRLLHYTTLEFLQSNLDCLDHDRDSKQPAPQNFYAAIQRGIAETCITFLSLGTSDSQFTNDVEAWESEDAKLLQKANKRKYRKSLLRFQQPNIWWRQRELLSRHPFLSYAVRHWGRHAFETAKDKGASTGLDMSILRLLATDTKVAAAARLASLHDIPFFATGMTGLHFAASFGLETVAIKLLESKHDLDATDNHGQTPLHYATREEHRVMVDFLLEKGATRNPADIHGWTPLLMSVKKGDTEMVKLFLKALNSDNTCSNSDKFFEKQEALLLATDQGNEAIFQMLLDDGAITTYKAWEDPDLIVPAFSILWELNLMDTTIPSLVVKNGHEQLFNILLEKETDLDLENRDGRTPLFFAAEYGHQEVAQKLLQIGANPDHIDCERETPLFLAINTRQEVISRQLLDHGANPDHINIDGRTPLFSAAYLENASITRELLDRGANPDHFDKYGRTPLFSAARSGNAFIIRELLDRGANPDHINIDGKTPLFSAADSGNASITRELLDRGVNPDHINGEGWTPLFFAVMWRYTSIARELLQRGANPDHVDKGGKTPLFLAMERKDEGMVQLLLEHHADPNPKPGHKLHDAGTHFQFAVTKGCENLASLLLSAGADPNLRYQRIPPLNIAGDRWE